MFEGKVVDFEKVVVLFFLPVPWEEVGFVVGWRGGPFFVVGVGLVVFRGGVFGGLGFCEVVLEC